MSNLQLDREGWLLLAAELLLDDVLYGHHNKPAPTYRISCGFPAGRKGKAIGSCWKKEASTDQTNEIFINPTIDDPLLILATLAHELIHALDDCESKHRGFFRRTAINIGLLPPMTATTPNDELTAKLNEIIDILPQYPHSKMDISKAPKQQTRMKKALCSDPLCGFTFRITQSNMEMMTAKTFCPACQNETLLLNV